MRELARRLAPQGIVTASTNPGAVVSPLTHGRVDEIVGWTPKVSLSRICGSNHAEKMVIMQIMIPIISVIK